MIQTWYCHRCNKLLLQLANSGLFAFSETFSFTLLMIFLLFSFSTEMLTFVESTVLQINKILSIKIKESSLKSKTFFRTKFIYAANSLSIELIEKNHNEGTCASLVDHNKSLIIFRKKIEKAVWSKIYPSISIYYILIMPLLCKIQWANVSISKRYW